jgi:TrmH family RNA methyltransferase
VTDVLTARSGRVNAARALMRRAARREQGRFLTEGPQGVREALARPGTVEELFVTAAAAERHANLIDAAIAVGVPVREVDGRALASLVETATPQGLVAVCRAVHQPLASALAGAPRLVAVLAHARDPGNTGTVIRTADAAGCDVVIVTEASVDAYNPKCVRSTAGSLFHVPVVLDVSVLDAVDAVRRAGLQVLAADGAGPTTLDDESERGSLAAPTAWLFGNEAWGLPAPTLALADAAVRVPIYGAAESLNLATAAAICLYASARDQRRPTARTRIPGARHAP